MNPNIHLGAFEAGMIPLDGKTLHDLVQTTLYNIRLFDHARFAVWIKNQTAAVQRAEKLCPPDRIYRVMTDDGLTKLLGIVIGYNPEGLCAFHVFGVHSGNGAYDMPLFVPPEVLLDVTVAAKAGTLGV